MPPLGSFWTASLNLSHLCGNYTEFGSQADLSGHLPPGTAGSNPARGMGVSHKCCVLSGMGLCGGPIPRLHECDQMLQ
jgi:hypothetical protein